jgi:hypothetical protein
MKHWLFFVVMLLADAAQAGTVCDQDYSALKDFEASESEQRNKDTAATIAALTSEDRCSEDSKVRADRSNLYAQKLAILAKDFVSACKDRPDRQRDLEIYSMPGVLDPGSSSLRDTCQKLGK